MKTMTKRTAVAALTGVMAVGMLTGCGEKKLDGTKTVVTVDGTEVPLGILSLSVREGQAQTEAMYKSFMGGQDYSIWSTDAEDGKTYGEQAVEQCLKDVELMYIMKEKAADYDVEVTDDDEKAIAEAAAAFMEANSDETIQELAVTEDQVKTYLELQTYKSRMHDPITADVDKDVSDEEAQQSSFDYVSISTADLSDDEIKQKKEDAQKILDDLKAAGSDGDLNEIAKAVDDSYSSVSGTFDANEDAAEEDSDDESDSSSSSSSAYPDEVIKVLRTLKDGEIGPDVIETDTSYYVVKLDKVNDEEATQTKKDSIISTRESNLYTETTEKWLDDADINVEKKVLKTLKVTDNHKFSFATATPEPTEEATEETTDETADAEATTTPEATEEAEETTTPEVTEAPSYSTDSSLEVKDGDKVNIDYVGKIDGTAFDGGSTDGNGTDLVIGSGTYIDNFEEQLVGAHPGDEVEVTVTFPDDYGVDELNGKEAVFDVTVNGIYE